MSCVNTSNWLNDRSSIVLNAPHAMPIKAMPSIFVFKLLFFEEQLFNPIEIHFFKVSILLDDRIETELLDVLSVHTIDAYACNIRNAFLDVIATLLFVKPILFFDFFFFFFLPFVDVFVLIIELDNEELLLPVPADVKDGMD